MRLQQPREGLARGDPGHRGQNPQLEMSEPLQTVSTLTHSINKHLFSTYRVPTTLLS